MNASFRTAFWAMCLGLTVPMILLVGVELTSGGRANRKSSLAAGDQTASLRSQWENAPSKGMRHRAIVAAAGKTDARREPRVGRSASAVADSGVTLDPQLEPDQSAAEQEPLRERRLPVLITGIRPNVEVPDDVPFPAAPRSDSREIETRLANIQSRLDRLGHAIADQPREPAADPARQAAELLKQLQQARELDKVAAQFPKLTEPQSDHLIGDPAPSEKATKPADADEKRGPVPEPLPAAKKKPRLYTKIYRPRHLSASALVSLVAPLLTPGIGKAGASDAGVDESTQAGGGDAPPAPVSAVVVRDYPEVLLKIDRLLKQLDVPPIPVMIEATVVTVRLRREMSHGIDLQEFNKTGQSFAITPADRVTATTSGSAAPPLSGTRESVLTHGMGLKCGVLKGDPHAFLSALEAAVQVRRTNAWQINVLDRQSAQVMVNDPFAAEGSSGIILKVRPVVAPGGLVTLDVRRDVDLDSSAARNRSAALTHQIVLREGQTAVAGGFYAEHLSASPASAPGTGPLRVTGPTTRRQPEVIERCETIVILTPHIVRADPVDPGQTRRTDISPSIVRRRPSAHQADGALPVKRATRARKDAPGQSVQTVHSAPADLPAKSAASLSEPGRLPAENATTARAISSEATAAGESPDLDDIPALEVSIPADNEQGPMIRPGGVQRKP
jgi:hypothetical protein